MSILRFPVDLFCHVFIPVRDMHRNALRGRSLRLFDSHRTGTWIHSFWDRLWRICIWSGISGDDEISFISATGIYDKLGDNCIQNLHLGRYIVGYTVGNLVLRRRVSGAVKRDFRTYIRRYTSPNENFEYSYPHSNALLTFSLQKDSENVFYCVQRRQLHKTARQLHIFTCQPMKSDVT